MFKQVVLHNTLGWEVTHTARLVVNRSDLIGEMQLEMVVVVTVMVTVMMTMAMALMMVVGLLLLQLLLLRS